MTEDVIIGIDLGTTNSVCAIYENDDVKYVPNSLGELLTPSVVGLDDDGSLLVGASAKQRLVTHPDKTVAFFKRLMGTDYSVELGKKSKFSAIELSSLVLKSLKKDAENMLGHAVEHAVISVPAYFNEHQRQATRDAGELAGLTVNRLINEPTAAAIAHGLQEKEEKTIMVLDLGGGTFDVSILEYFSGVLEVHASSGDSALGGEDFTNALASAFFQASGINADDFTTIDKQRLYARMETAKRSHKSKQKTVVEFDHNGNSYTWDLTDESLKQATASLLMRIREPMERALKDADKVRSEIDEVILVGGATRMQVIQSLVATTFTQLPRTDVNPDLTIAAGAAIQAGLVQKNESLDDIVLTDVCPFSLGVGVHIDNGVSDELGFSPILERNSVVPASRQESYYTVETGQTEINLQVFQGESPRVKNNLFLGDIKVPVPLNEKYHEQMDVRFSYDVNGLLEIDILVPSSGIKINKLIENRPGSLTEKEKSKSIKRLSNLKVLPRDREEIRSILARAERVYESLLGDKRDLLAQLLTEYEKVLARQNPREITQASEEFEKNLDRLDDDVWV